MVFGGKKICIKADKARFRTRQYTNNYELDWFKRTFGRAYIIRITYAAARDGDTCTIGIFLLR